MPELSVAAAHLRQEADWLGRTAKQYENLHPAWSEENRRYSAYDLAVAVLLEAIARRGENEILTMAHVRVAAARVAAVVVPQTERTE